MIDIDDDLEHIHWTLPVLVLLLVQSGSSLHQCRLLLPFFEMRCNQ